MLSQYSWWDFIKFVLVLAVPYYAFVIFKYYREDIREWISSRGQAKPADGPEEPEEEEEMSSAIFTVKDYSQPTAAPATTQAKATERAVPTEWLPEPVAPTAPSVGLVQQPQPFSQGALEEVELQGPPVESESDVVFGLPITLSVDSLSEQSVDEVMRAANQLTPDEQGKLTPVDADDQSAVRLAQVINQQKESPLNNFAFNR